MAVLILKPSAEASDPVIITYSRYYGPCRLYDNPQIAKTYLEAFQCTGKPEYAFTVRGVLDYLLRDMRHPEGGFYSAEVSMLNAICTGLLKAS